MKNITRRLPSIDLETKGTIFKLAELGEFGGRAVARRSASAGTPSPRPRLRAPVSVYSSHLRFGTQLN